MPSLLVTSVENQLRVESDVLRWPHLIGVELVDDHRQRVKAIEIELRSGRQVVGQCELDALTCTRAQDERLDSTPGLSTPVIGSRSSERKYMIAVGSWSLPPNVSRGL